MSLNNLNLSTLPDEIQLNIYKYLDAPNLARLSCVNKEIYRLAQDNFLWNRLLEDCFPDQMRRAAKRESQDYKKVFIRAIETERRIDKAKYSQKVLDSYLPAHYIKFKGNRLVTGSASGSICIWDIEKEKSATIFQSSPISCLQFKDDLLITGGAENRSNDSKGIATIWDIASGHTLKILSGHDRQVFCLQFKKDLLATGSLDCTIRIWSIESGECTKILRGHNNFIGYLKILGDQLASGSSDRTVRIWDIKSGVCLKKLPPPPDLEYACAPSCLDFKGNELAIIGYRNQIYVFDMKRENWTTLFNEKSLIKNLQLEDNRLLFFSETNFRFLNMKSNLPTQTYDHYGVHSKSIKFKEGRLIFATHSDLIHIWDFNE